jgi:enterochelin esterase-like enzyme
MPGKFIRSVGLRPFATFLFLVAGMDSSGQTCRSGLQTRARLERFQSTIFNREQTLRIWLPNEYRLPANAQKTYPVLYLFDGQYVLPECPETAWLPIDETVPQLIEKRKLQPMIIVGIDSETPRSHEYLPFKSWFEEPLDEPVGAKIPQFLSSEVMPVLCAKAH